jgi:gliding motility-associated-like protein
MRRILQGLFAFFALSIIQFNLLAQPCATLQIIGPPTGTIPCDSALTLSALVTFPTGINNTTTYSHDTIPFNPAPFVGPNPIIVNVDDVWSGVVPLPFPFCFFGNTYTDMIVSSNGQIGFDLSQASMGNAWATSTWGPAPVNNITFNNSIMSPHHDILPTNPGAIITWGVFGVAPCRTMVVSWTNCSMFSCTTLIDTQQIVLYELTNEIDINIKNKPLCPSWNGGVAYEGIQNATGTVAYMTPGRNGTQWTANDDAYRFTPNGPPTPIAYSFTWTNAVTGAILGTGPNLTLPPPVTIDSLICTVNVTGGCAPYSFTSTYVPGVGKVNANFTYEKRYGCFEDTVIFTNTSNPSTATNYTWFFGDLTTSTDPNPTHIYANQDTFTVRLIADHPPCIPDTIDILIDIRHPIDAVFTMKGANGKDSVCLGDPFLATTASTVNAALVEWAYYWGDGTSDVLTTNTPVPHTYTTPGTYTATHVIRDTLGCIDSTTYLVFVDNPPFEAFTISDDTVCAGDPIFFKDTLAPFVQRFEWDFGDGKRLVNVHNPTHSYDYQNDFTVWLIGYYLICPADSVSKVIKVEEFLNVSLGPDTMMCPGITGSILLADVNNPTAFYTWSTGEVTPSIVVTQPGRYWVAASTRFAGCTTIDSIWVKRDCYLNIPNSFSPNGDGRNDFFLPRELLSSGLKSFNMNIYNRWGELIFTTDNINGRGWDGKYNNVDQPMGVFVYTINAQFINNVKKTFSGNVTLMR